MSLLNEQIELEEDKKRFIKHDYDNIIAFNYMLKNNKLT